MEKTGNKTPSIPFQDPTNEREEVDHLAKLFASKPKVDEAQRLLALTQSVDSASESEVWSTFGLASKDVILSKWAKVGRDTISFLTRVMKQTLPSQNKNDDFQSLEGPSGLSPQHTLQNRIHALRDALLSSCNEVLVTHAGKDGEAMIKAAREIDELCKVHHFVLKRVVAGKITGEEFTLRVGPRRKGQADKVVLVTLSQKTKDGSELGKLPEMTVVPLESLDELRQEIVVGRWRSQLLGSRIGGKFLSQEDRSRGGNSRAKKLPKKRRSEIAKMGSDAAAKTK